MKLFAAILTAWVVIVCIAPIIVQTNTTAATMSGPTWDTDGYLYLDQATRSDYEKFGPQFLVPWLVMQVCDCGDDGWECEDVLLRHMVSMDAAFDSAFQHCPLCSPEDMFWPMSLSCTPGDSTLMRWKLIDGRVAVMWTPFDYRPEDDPAYGECSRVVVPRLVKYPCICQECEGFEE